MNCTQALKLRDIMKLPVSAIRPNPNQPRRTFDIHALSALADSIQTYGLMQPVVVRIAGSGFELIAGERRWRACRSIGMEQIDAVVIDADNESSACMALIENLQREELHYFDEAQSFSAIMEMFSLTQEQLAARIGRSQSSIANKLRLLKLPVCIKSLAAEYGLSERHARELLRLEDERSMEQITRSVFEKHLSVKETSRLIDQYIEKHKPRQKITKLIRDQRLYINSIKAAVKEINTAGAKADMRIEKENGDVVIIVRIACQQEAI